MKACIRIRLVPALLGILCLLALSAAPVRAQVEGPYQYELFNNTEGFGILVFPQARLFPGLKDFITGLGFVSLESGTAVMRFGTKRENITYMMPEEVQDKYGMARFIILQILENGSDLMVGIYDPKHGLTLPAPVYDLEAVQKGIPLTLEAFRKEAGKRPL